MRAMTLLVLSLLLASTADAQMRDRGSLLDRADANNDGLVTRDEFMKARAEQFASRDRNGDGFIDERDIGKRAARRARVSQALEAVIAQLDSNNDGKVSKQEFVDGGAKLFDRVDADKNGSLDKNEIEAAKASLREAAGM